MNAILIGFCLLLAGLDLKIYRDLHFHKKLIIFQMRQHFVFFKEIRRNLKLLSFQGRRLVIVRVIILKEQALARSARKVLKGG